MLSNLTTPASLQPRTCCCWQAQRPGLEAELLSPLQLSDNLLLSDGCNQKNYWMDRRVLVAELQRALKLHVDLAVHPQHVSGNRFHKCFMKPFVKWEVLFFVEVAKRFCLKTGFLLCLCQRTVERWFLDSADSHWWRMTGLWYLMLTHSINSRCTESKVHLLQGSEYTPCAWYCLKASKEGRYFFL